jgi:hypothetical protein
LLVELLKTTREFTIINHTNWGVLTINGDDFLANLENETGTGAFAPISGFAH